MSLANGDETGLSGPSTPLSFATYSDLSAAVAANGGQPLDGTLQARVGDALYVWDASSGVYVLVGSAAPYSTLAALNAAVPSPVIGQAYPYVTGYLVWTATGWLGDIGVVATLAEAQALTGIADGSTITAAGLLYEKMSVSGWVGRSSLVSPAEMPSVLAWYDARSLSLSDGAAIATLADSSGRNGNAVQATTANKPIYRPLRCNNAPTMEYDGARFLTFTEIATAKTIICVCAFDDPQIDNYTVIVGSAASAYFAGAAKTDGHMLDSGAVPAATYRAQVRLNGLDGGRGGIMVMSRPTSPTIVTIRMADGDTATVGNITIDRMVSNRRFKGIYSSLAVFGTRLTDDECYRVERYLANSYNISMEKPTTIARANAIFWGDSRTVGQGSTGGNTYQSQLASLLGGSSRLAMEPLGVSGSSAQQYDVTYAGQYMYATYPRICNCANNVIHVWLGINGLSDSTVATVYQSLKNLWAKARGYGAKVVAYTETPRSNAGTDPTFENARTTLNGLIRAERWRYDYLVDLAADSRIGPAGAETDTTYYADLVHMTNAGYGVVAELSAPAYAAFGL